MSILKLYLEINYFGQKIGNKYNVENGLVNIILTEIGYISIGLFAGLYIGFGFREPLVAAIIAGVLVLIIITVPNHKIKRNIDFESLESSYKKASKQKRISYFIISMFLLLSSLALMVFLIKILVSIMW